MLYIYILCANMAYKSHLFPSKRGLNHPPAPELGLLWRGGHLGTAAAHQAERRCSVVLLSPETTRNHQKPLAKIQGDFFRDSVWLTGKKSIEKHLFAHFCHFALVSWWLTVDPFSRFNDKEQGMGVVLPTSEKFADRFHLGICRWRMHLRPSLSIPMISPISWPLDMRRWWKFGARSREWGTLFADRGWVKGYLFGIASGICSPPRFRLAQVVPQVSLIFPFVLSFWFALFETMPCHAP